VLASYLERLQRRRNVKNARALFPENHAQLFALGVCFLGLSMTSATTGLLRFAVVEDDPFMAELVSDMLASSGVEVEVFMLGTGLLKSANLHQFKAIVLDLSLPDIDGFDLMDNLAEHAAGMSVVLMSGHDLATVRAAKIYGNGIGLKMRGALTKPFTKVELFAALGLQA
jgi:CheY-like chemotaxis protein